MEKLSNIRGLLFLSLEYVHCFLVYDLNTHGGEQCDLCFAVESSVKTVVSHFHSSLMVSSLIYQHKYNFKSESIARDWP